MLTFLHLKLIFVTLTLTLTVTPKILRLIYQLSLCVSLSPGTPRVPIGKLTGSPTTDILIIPYFKWYSSKMASHTLWVLSLLGDTSSWHIWCHIYLHQVCLFWPVHICALDQPRPHQTVCLHKIRRSWPTCAHAHLHVTCVWLISKFIISQLSDCLQQISCGQMECIWMRWDPEKKTHTKWKKCYIWSRQWPNWPNKCAGCTLVGQPMCNRLSNFMGPRTRCEKTVCL